MEFILAHKWAFLIASELIFWISILSFLILRYWYRFTKASFLFFGIFILNDLWIAVMGYMDYLKTGMFSTYQIIVVVFVIYALTYGKSDFRKLDAFIQKKVAKLKGEPVESKGQEELTGFAYALKEWKGFSVHLAVFLIAQLLLILFVGFSGQMETAGSLQSFLGLWFSKAETLPYEHASASNFTKIWTIILAADCLSALSYTIFPKTLKKEYQP